MIFVRFKCWKTNGFSIVYKEERYLAGGLTGWLSEWSTGPLHLHPSLKYMIFSKLKSWKTIGLSMVLKGGSLAGWYWLVVWVVGWSTWPSPFIQMYDFWILEIEMLKNYWFFNGFKGMSVAWLVGWLAGCLAGGWWHDCSPFQAVQKPLVFQHFNIENSKMINLNEGWSSSQPTHHALNSRCR